MSLWTISYTLQANTPWPRHWLCDGWPLMLGGGLKAEKTFRIFLFRFTLDIFGVIGDFGISLDPCAHYCHHLPIPLKTNVLSSVVWRGFVFKTSPLRASYSQNYCNLLSLSSTSLLVVNCWVIFCHQAKFHKLSWDQLEKCRTRQPVHDYVENSPGRWENPAPLSSICKCPPSREAFDKQPIFRPLWAERGVWRGGDVY